MFGIGRGGCGQVLLVDIGLVYYSILEQPEQALACFEQARALFERIDDPRGLTRVYGNMGLQYYALGKYEDALRHHQRANALAKSSGDRRLIAKYPCRAERLRTREARRPSLNGNWVVNLMRDRGR